MRFEKRIDKRDNPSPTSYNPTGAFKFANDKRGNIHMPKNKRISFVEA